jgi:hypothetical protein
MFKFNTLFVQVVKETKTGLILLRNASTSVEAMNLKRSSIVQLQFATVRMQPFTDPKDANPFSNLER